MTYELTLLLKEEEDLKRIKELIDSLKIKIVKENLWGRKTLAYPIKKQSAAYFYLYLLEIDKKNVGEFKKKLNFDEKIMRHLLITISTKGRSTSSREE